jgi:hypothetical protein
MQVGDLVELSAAGKKAQQNVDIIDGAWGIIMGLQDMVPHPFKITWYFPTGKTMKHPMARYEIKKMRGKK